MGADIYKTVLAELFNQHYTTGAESFEFEREELRTVATGLGIPVPQNLGDVIYSFRSRGSVPDSIKACAPPEREWIIEGAGIGRYRFRLVGMSRIKPNSLLDVVKIPDSTPEIISRYAQSDEQALLAKVRYNRLVDIFLSVTAYSLQNHLRTTVQEVGQIEIDELYVGVNASGSQFVIPVQAKGGSDHITVVQISQDLAYCEQQYTALVARPVAAQFMSEGTIAMFELRIDGEEVKIREERHYRLVPSNEISDDDLKFYRM